jgi:protein involved in plasmid replication-relaxation
MRDPMQLPKGSQNMLRSLAVFDYLTTAQATKLCYAKGSRTYGHAGMKALVDNELALAIGGRGIQTPLIYTLTGKGRHYASQLGAARPKRVRPSEEMEKGHNHYFLKHTIAVTDVLIAAKLLSERVPAIRLARMYTERELKRKIYVTLSGKTCCLEPDASLLFRVTETWHEPPETWENFFHIEVYRTHLREDRFKHKINTYAAYATSPLHKNLFHTPALTIAMFCADDDLAARLKQWTEEVLQEGQQSALGERFFFSSINPATASPEVLFLSPLWEQAFSTTKTPLLMLENDA